MAHTLVITNDFGPAIGGIESFVSWVCQALDAQVVVLTRRHSDAAAFDRRLDYPVVRTGQILVPSPRVAQLAADLVARHRLTRVVYGAAAPLGLLAPALRRAGVRHQLALSHGHETWWSRVTPTKVALRHIADQVDHLSYISEFTASVIGPRLSPAARSRMLWLPPPVDTDVFVPPAQRPRVPTVIAAGRMIGQKGFDTLVQAWAQVQAGWLAGPRPRLILVGDGPQRGSLAAAVRRLGLTDSVAMTGSLAHHNLVGQLQQAHIFALPVRTRWAGLNPEGLGLVFLEAAATGLAVLAGDSGGAGETLIDGRTGILVRPGDVSELAHSMLDLLNDLPRAARMGAEGRQLVQSRFAAEAVRVRLREALSLPVE